MVNNTSTQRGIVTGVAGLMLWLQSPTLTGCPPGPMTSEDAGWIVSFSTRMEQSVTTTTVLFSAITAF